MTAKTTHKDTSMKRRGWLALEAAPPGSAGLSSWLFATWWRALSDHLGHVTAATRVSIERNRQRRALGELDDRLLRDVGLTRAAARRECAKPFWRQ